MAVQTIQPGPADGKDASILRNSPDSNWGGGADFVIGVHDNNAESARCLLIEFSLAVIPSGSTINTAKLCLYFRLCESAILQNLDCFRVTQAWVEGTKIATACETGATWNKYDCANAWAVAGGDFNAAVLASVDEIAQDYGWKEWTGLGQTVQDWLDGVNDNYGFLLKGAPEENSGHQKIFYASEELTQTTLRPKLVVDYTPPTAGDYAAIF